jgi:hypothetical protein
VTQHLAVLQFEAGGPAVTGEWADSSTALRTYLEWIGLYGSQQSVVIRLVEEVDGVWHTRRKWAAQREIVTDTAEPTA